MPSFLGQLLERHYHVIEDDENPELLLFSVFNSAHFRYDCHKVFVTGEQVAPDFGFCDYALSFQENDERNLYMPWFDQERMALFMDDNSDPWDGPTVPPPQNAFLLFLSSNPLPTERKTLCRQLMPAQGWSTARPVLNNMSLPEGDGTRGNWYQEQLDLFKHYRFTIAFENESSTGYITQSFSAPVGR